METGSQKVPESEPAWLTALMPALNRLDGLLEQAIASAQQNLGSEAASDRFRGLYIPGGEARRLLQRPPGVPVYSVDRQTVPPPNREGDTLALLADQYALGDFDLDVLLIALAPDLDRRYERIYAYLQDNVSLRRPTVDLVLNILCSDALDRLQRRAHFASDAPLIRHNLVHLVPSSDQAAHSLLAHALEVDGQITNLILNHRHLDSRLVPICQEWSSPPLAITRFDNGDSPGTGAGVDAPRTMPSTLPAHMYDALHLLARQALSQGDPLLLCFQGEPGLGQQETALSLAADLSLPLLATDLADGAADVHKQLPLLFRHAQFNGAVLCLFLPDAPGVDWEKNGHASQFPPELRALQRSTLPAHGVIILVSRHPIPQMVRPDARLVTIPFGRPSFATRRSIWRAALSQQGLNLDAEKLDQLAGRFRLGNWQIENAVRTAASNALLQPANSSRGHPSQPSFAELLSEARAQTGLKLGQLARKVSPIHRWDDLVLPDDSQRSLREICQRVQERHQVLDTWGFGKKLSLGKGTNALFTGPSGTGKTMAASIIANELGLDLYKIDLSGVVSKYIGETEKNLHHIFAAATDGNAILFFDEADALFGKRSEVRDSHDRYANIEISYLLQKMEEYDGVSILATNLRHHLDEAFVRRLAITVEFPFPGEESRRQIWERIWPEATPLAPDVDLGYMARKFKLSGGNIKNVALAAAYLAAHQASPVTMTHLLRACESEYQKMGKVLTGSHLDERMLDGYEMVAS